MSGDAVGFGVMGLGTFGGSMIEKIGVEEGVGAPGCVVTALGSRDASKSRRVGEEVGLGAGVGFTYEEMLGRADVDVVYVALPHHLHVEWCRRALEAGKHVLCEKPLCWNRADAEGLFGLAASRGLVLAEGFMYVHHPQTDLMRGMARRALGLEGEGGGDPLIGELMGVRSYRESSLLDRPHIMETRFRWSMHGGSLMDVGCYALSWARWVTGCELSGLEVTDHGMAPLLDGEERGVDGWCGWRGRVEHGGAREVWFEGACSVVKRDRQTAELVGTEGTLWTDWAWSPDDGHHTLFFDPAGGGERREIAVEGRARRAESQFASMAAAVREGRVEGVPGRAFSEGHAGSMETLLRGMGVVFEG